MFDYKSLEFSRRSSLSAASNVITTLHRGSELLVEELCCPTPCNDPDSVGLTARFHIVLPLSGSFHYLEFGRSFYAGVNHVLLLPPGREYRTAHPIEGDLSIVVYPSSSVIEQLSCIGTRWKSDSEIRTVSPEMRLRALALRSAARVGADRLTLDELAIDFCGAVFRAGNVDALTSPAGRAGTLGRAKEYLHAHYRDFSQPCRGRVRGGC